MISVTFLFTLFALVLSADRSSFHATSLLGKIRKDPHALATILGATSETRFTDIVQLLEELVAEGNAEIQSIDSSIEECEEEVEEAKQAMISAESVEAQKKEKYDAAVITTSTAEGVMQSVKATYDSEAPHLEKEIEVFEKVINILSQLNISDETSESLAELVTPELRTLISLAVQADPVKVQNILDLLNNLLSESNTELVGIADEVTIAEQSYNASVAAQVEANGEYELSKTNHEKATANFNTLTGTCDTKKSVGNARQEVVTGEIATLQAIITMLNDLSL